MTSRRGQGLVAIPIVFGAVLAALWLRAAGGGAVVRRLLEASPLWVAAALAVTGTWLFVRFLRWQFLLRRVGVRLPIRSTLGTYLAGLPGTMTPAYIGEAIRGIFIRRRYGVPMRLSIAVLVLERLHDAGALAILLLVTGAFLGNAAALQLGALFVFLCAGAAIVLRPVALRVGIRDDAVRRLLAPETTGVVALVSLTAWAVAGALVWLAAQAVGQQVGVVEGQMIFARSALLGAASLLPGGIGVTSSVAIVELGRAGLATADAVLVVMVLRLTSTGAALVTGCLFLWRELRSIARDDLRPAEGTAHFDHIAEQYNAQWSPHVWDLLIDRKLGFIAEALPSPERAGVGLDLGCGLGLQTHELRRRGFEVIGLDPSIGLLAVGRRRLGESMVVAGSALQLPLADACVDFVYTIGVLHHLSGPEAQAAALLEVARVLKPGGLLIVHESNPRNPLFRFYMGYLFPILKTIDEGTEWWIDPRRWSSVPRLELTDVRYFTFLPDFTPRLLMKPALMLEGLLERGPTRVYSAHYMAVLRKQPVMPDVPRVPHPST